ncbi:MAG: CbiX/SirB N-terminal domain-containing protein [Actinomycetes bacterium]
MTTGLLIVAHGSPDRRHRDTVARLAQRVTAEVNGPVRVGFLDHDQPSVTSALVSLAETTAAAVAVSLLLTPGYHDAVDVPQSLARAPAGLAVTYAGSLGLGPWLHPLLARRAAQCGAATTSAVVVCAAGSSSATARREVRLLATRWSAVRGGPVHAAFATGAGPDLVEALGLVRQASERPVVVPLLLSEGVLSDRVRATVAEIGGVTSDVLGTDPEVVDRVVELVEGAGARVPVL